MSGNGGYGFRWTQGNGDLFPGLSMASRILGTGLESFCLGLHNGTELAMVAGLPDPLRAPGRWPCDKNLARTARSYEEIYRRGRKEETRRFLRTAKTRCSHGQKALTVIRKAELLRARGAFASNRARRRIRQFFCFEARTRWHGISNRNWVRSAGTANGRGRLFRISNFHQPLRRSSPFLPQAMLFSTSPNALLKNRCRWINRAGESL